MKSTPYPPSYTRAAIEFMVHQLKVSGNWGATKSELHVLGDVSSQQEAGE